MRSILNIGLPAVLLLMLLSVGAAAQTEIIVEQGSSGMIQFAATGSRPQIIPSGVCAQSNCVAGGAYSGTKAVTDVMWLTGYNPIATAAPTSNMFAADMNGVSATFNFVVGSSTIAASISNTGAPRRSRPLTVAGSSNSFAALWKSSGVVPPDLAASASSHSPSSDSGDSESGVISSREILGTSTAPEPASIALIGSGLLAIGGVLKRRLRR